MNRKGYYLPEVVRYPLVEVSDDCRVLIENHKGVKQYSRSEISVAVRYGQIRIIGHCLQLEHMTKERLVITGQIDQVCLHRG